MLLLEHHGKALLRSKGIATPRGVVVGGVTELEHVRSRLPARRLVLKAQVQAGGRGKSGGIAFAGAEDDIGVLFAKLHAQRIGGLPVQSVLIEEQVDYVSERFIALAVEDGELRLMLGRDGGIHVEDSAANDAESIAVLTLDPIDGPDASVITDRLVALGIPPVFHTQYCALARTLFHLAQEHDARLIEINPIVELQDGGLIALDAKVDIDVDALPRHPEFTEERTGHAAPVSKAVSDGHLNFKQNPEPGGTIGVIGLGGGLNVTLMDWIQSIGGRAAVLVDMDPAIGSGRATEGFKTALARLDADPAIRATLVNIVTCGYRLDEIVESLIEALAAHAAGGSKPVVLHLRGNSMSRTPGLLSSIGCSNSPSIADAVAAVVKAGSV
jgi:succinyl-CoA synthetase beta subunit